MPLTKDFLISVVKEQNQTLRSKIQSYVSREIEADIINSLKTTDFIHVIQGPRRSGKSTLLAYLKTKVFRSGYYLNFDDERLVDFQTQDFNTLLEAFIETYGPSKFIYLDEVQNIPAWERFVSRLKEQGYKVVVTGSNSRLLSREFGTHLTGRYVPYTLFPFSFREFLAYKNAGFYKEVATEKVLTTQQRALLDKYFKQYLKYGGIPEYVKTRRTDFIKTLYENILYRDIIARYDIKNDLHLRQLSVVAASNIGKIISFRSFKSLGIKSTTTISQYFDYLTQTYLYFLVPKFSYSLRESLRSNKKLYILDPALAKLVGVRFSEDQGRFLENIVFLDLKRQYPENHNIFYYKNDSECDFVILEDNRVSELIQVTHSLRENRERETKGLIDAMEHLNLDSNTRATVVTLEESGELTLSYSNKKCKSCELKVQVVPIARWLVSRNRAYPKLLNTLSEFRV